MELKFCFFVGPAIFISRLFSSHPRVHTRSIRSSGNMWLYEIVNVCVCMWTRIMCDLLILSFVLVFVFFVSAAIYRLDARDNKHNVCVLCTTAHKCSMKAKISEIALASEIGKNNWNYKLWWLSTVLAAAVLFIECMWFIHSFIQTHSLHIGNSHFQHKISMNETECYSILVAFYLNHLNNFNVVNNFWLRFC